MQSEKLKAIPNKRWNKELSKTFYEKQAYDYEEYKHSEDLFPQDNRTLLEKNFIHLAITSVAAVAVFIAILVAPKLIVINMTLAAIFLIAAAFSCLKFFIDIKNESLFIERQLQRQKPVSDIANNHKPLILSNNNNNIMTPDPKKDNLR